MIKKSDMILISIHPNHIENIISGKKRYEYRKKVPNNIQYLALYATSPVMRIVGIAKVEKIISAPPQLLWRQTRGSSGISFTFFKEYFQKSNTSYAIELSDIRIFKKAISLDDRNLNVIAPQSYYFLTEQQKEWLQNHSFERIDKRSLIFIGGIHGSGKTYISKNYLSTFSYKHNSASNIIKEEGNEIKIDKTVDNLDLNQIALIQGLKKIENINRRNILDGHFCLINKDFKIEKIPFEVFKKINPTMIILTTAPDKEIMNRIKKRNIDNNYNISIKMFQEAEEEYAFSIAKELNIPILKIDTSKNNKLIIRNIDKFLLSEK